MASGIKRVKKSRKQKKSSSKVSGKSQKKSSSKVSGKSQKKKSSPSKPKSTKKKQSQGRKKSQKNFFLKVYHKYLKLYLILNSHVI